MVMIEQLICHGVHAYGTVGDEMCRRLYDGTVTDLLCMIVAMQAAYIFISRLMRV
jgi:hypothetical protein